MVSASVVLSKETGRRDGPAESWRSSGSSGKGARAREVRRALGAAFEVRYSSNPVGKHRPIVHMWSNLRGAPFDTSSFAHCPWWKSSMPREKRASTGRLGIHGPHLSQCPAHFAIGDHVVVENVRMRQSRRRNSNSQTQKWRSTPATGAEPHREDHAVQAVAEKKIECGTIFTSRRSRARSRFFALSAREIRWCRPERSLKQSLAVYWWRAPSRPPTPWPSRSLWPSLKPPAIRRSGTSSPAPKVFLSRRRKTARRFRLSSIAVARSKSGNNKD